MNKTKSKNSLHNKETCKEKTKKITICDIAFALALTEINPKERRYMFWERDWSNKEQLIYTKRAKFIKRRLKI